MRKSSGMGTGCLAPFLLHGNIVHFFVGSFLLRWTTGACGESFLSGVYQSQYSHYPSTSSARRESHILAFHLLVHLRKFAEENLERGQRVVCRFWTSKEIYIWMKFGQLSWILTLNSDPRVVAKEQWEPVILEREGAQL